MTGEPTRQRENGSPAKESAQQKEIRKAEEPKRKSEIGKQGIEEPKHKKETRKQVIKEPTQRISEDAVKMWRISDAITYGVMLCLLVILLFLDHFYDWKSWIQLVLYLLVILVCVSSVVEIIAVPVYRQKTWRYEVDEKFIQLKYGGVFKTTHLIIPMAKVQYVNTNQGPISQKYGLSTITIGTMASVHEISALPEEKAAELRENIAFLAGVKDEPNET